MTTIIDYVRRATTPLRADLTPADALTLATLSYANFRALAGPAPPGDASCARSPRPRPSSPSTITRWSPNVTVHFCARGPRRPPAEGSADSGRPRPLRGLCECLSAASDRLAPLPPNAHVNPPSSGSAAPPRSYRRTPLVRTQARNSEAGPSRPHAGPQFRMRAASPTLQLAGLGYWTRGVAVLHR